MRLLLSARPLGLLVLAVMGFASRSAASIITVPPGLSVGDTYQLVFITSTTDAATSSNIADYNAFVTGVAAPVTAALALLGDSVTWTAIVSTATVSAAANIGTSTDEIYLLNGNEVADGTAGLFSGSLDNAIDIDENGATKPAGALVWTGSTSSGGIAPGNGALGSTKPEQGVDSDTNSSWIQNGTATSPDTSHDLYAISSVLTVPDPPSVPEPSTIGMAALGGMLLFLARRRRQVI
jgi:hypothetical protein